MRVLVAERDPDLRDLLRAVFVDEGDTVTLASSQDEARRVLSAVRHDVALVGGFAPGQLTIDAQDRARIRAIAALAPTVLISAHAWMRRCPAASLGVRAVLGEPFELEELLATVAAATRAPGSDSSEPSPRRPARATFP